MTRPRRSEAPERQGSMFITKSLTNSKVSFPKVWSETLTDCEKAGMFGCSNVSQQHASAKLCLWLSFVAFSGLVSKLKEACSFNFSASPRFLRRGV